MRLGRLAATSPRLDKPLAISPKPVAIIMGSQSDWATMRRAAETLEELAVGFDAQIISAHRTPDRLVAFAKGARAVFRKRQARPEAGGRPAHDQLQR